MADMKEGRTRRDKLAALDRSLKALFAQAARETPAHLLHLPDQLARPPRADKAA